MSTIHSYRIIIRSDYSSATLHPLDTTLSLEIITIHGLSQLRTFYTNDIVRYDSSTSTLTLETPSSYRKKCIPGILLIDSNYKYGSNSRGVPRYQCRPIIPNLPNFLVCSKIVSQLKKQRRPITKQAIYFQILSWPSDSMYPYGSLQQQFGSHNLPSANYSLLKQKHQLVTKSYSKSFRTFCQTQFQQHIESRGIDTTSIRYQLTDFTISIDPQGCTDIDDALSIRKETINQQTIQYTVGIHITDILAILSNLPSKYQSEWSTQLLSKLTTIYTPNTPHKQNMLPESISCQIASLQERQPKLVWSLLLHVQTTKADSSTLSNTFSNLQLINSKFQQSTICLMKNFSYQRIDSLLQEEISIKNEDIHQLFEISKYLAITYCGYTPKEIVSWNSHKMIEIYMVYMNQEVAQWIYVYSYKLPKGIRPMIRTRPNQAIVPPQYPFHYHPAEYQFVEPPSIKDNKTIINTSFYTHFTSPIRRFVDIYMHWILCLLQQPNSPICQSSHWLYQFFSQLNSSQLIISCNETHTHCKQYARDCMKFQLYQKVVNLPKQPYESTGILIDIEKDNCADIWLPEFQLLFHQRLIPYELDSKFTLLVDGTLQEHISATESISRMTLILDTPYPIQIFCRMTEVRLSQKITIHFPELSQWLTSLHESHL